MMRMPVLFLLLVGVLRPSRPAPVAVAAPGGGSRPAAPGYYYNGNAVVQPPWYQFPYTDPNYRRPYLMAKEAAQDTDDAVSWFVRDGGYFLQNLINPYTVMLLLGYEAAQKSNRVGSGPWKDWSSRLKDFMSTSQAERVLPK